MEANKNVIINEYILAKRSWNLVFFDLLELLWDILLSVKFVKQKVIKKFSTLQTAWYLLEKFMKLNLYSWF